MSSKSKAVAGSFGSEISKAAKEPPKSILFWGNFQCSAEQYDWAWRIEGILSKDEFVQGLSPDGLQLTVWYIRWGAIYQRLGAIYKREEQHKLIRACSAGWLCMAGGLWRDCTFSLKDRNYAVYWPQVDTAELHSMNTSNYEKAYKSTK